MEDFIVIGGGIMGATIGLALRKQGRKGLIIDDGRKMAGTRPSGGHLKPSWFSGMKKEDYEPAMELLNNVWGLDESEFKIRPSGLTTTVYRVDTDQVVSIKKTIGKVTGLDSLDKYPIVRVGEERYRCRWLVIAGVSFSFTGTVEPFIKLWAPYKQIVAHQQSKDRIWVGDGTAILSKNWTKEREIQCRKRCAKPLGVGNKLKKITTGLRPYVKKTDGQPCLLKRPYPQVWIATGASKLGTLAAGWAARRIIDATS